MATYTFDDLNCKAWFQERGEGKSPFLVVEEGGKVIGKRLAGRIKDTEADVRHAALSVLKAVQEARRMGEGLCPKCETKMVDNRIKEGRHKGHGRIACPACGYGITI